ncbi:MAG: T9SS type A sorting domain-containing protein [Lewinellaceae bacterium]|nr:T9SS type A sorting domain-containing protein [Lewinellaceae bacterium]
MASHGFAKFNIKPRFDAPLETLIENTAAIYFDFNDPVFTNTTFHHLGDNFITVGLWQPVMPKAEVIAVPNPFHEQTMLEVKGLVRSTGLRLQVFDLLGNVVREMESEDAIFQLRKGDWPSGIYLFKITQNGRLVGSGKLMAE